MTQKSALDMFGEYLMSKVRDEAINDWERVFSGRMKDEESQQLYETLKSFNSDQLKFVAMLFPRIVDTTLHHLLWSLENEEEITVTIKSDENSIVNIREVSDGLAGELYTENGWISRYSNKFGRNKNDHK